MRAFLAASLAALLCFAPLIVAAEDATTFEGGVKIKVGSGQTFDAFSILDSSDTELFSVDSSGTVTMSSSTLECADVDEIELTASAADSVPLIINLDGSQTADGFQLLSSGGSELVIMEPDGDLTIAGSYTGDHITLTASAADEVPATINLAGSQSADGFRILASGGSELFAVEDDGKIVGVSDCAITDDVTAARFAATADAADSVPLAVTLHASQSADGFQVLDSSSSELFAVEDDGKVVGAAGLSIYDTAITASAADAVPLTVTMAGSQTADGFRLLDSSSSEVFAVEDDGKVVTTGDITSTGELALGDSATIEYQDVRIQRSGSAAVKIDDTTASGDVALTHQGTVTVGTGTATDEVPLTVNKLTSQTADLLQVTDESDAEMVTVEADGDLVVDSAGSGGYIIGIPKLDLVGLGALTDGSAETVELLDDSPTGEWTEVDSGTNVALTGDTSVYKKGSKSLKVALGASAVAGDGADGTITSDDLTDNESVGFWVYSDTALSAGDFEIELDDDDAASDYTVNFPAVSSTNTWTWVEMDISSCEGSGSDCDAVDGIKFLMTSQGATNLDAVNVYLDMGIKWDAANEEALGQDIIEGGVISVLGLANGEQLTELTDYYVHYESGNDFLVIAGDHDDLYGGAFVAYK